MTIYSGGEGYLQQNRNERLSDYLKDLAPPAARRMSRRIKAVLRQWKNRRLSPQEVFTRVYAEKMWGGGPEAFYSGPGSNDAAARPYADFVLGFAAQHGIKRIVDLGCGDFRVGRLIVRDGIDITGVDVVQPLIAENNRRFSSAAVRFQCLDITTDPLPDGDLCLIREVFQHISNAQISAVLDKLHKYKHVLFTDVQPDDISGYAVNRDKVHGDSSRLVHESCLKLDKPPFNIRGVRLVFEATPQYAPSYAPFGSGFKMRTYHWEPAPGE